ncbi:DUF1156 domain-containing protein [Mitsuokella jalaludinii]|uniref:DUF1156 domain-containing protein n=1 Tax=Mitsuokella jalaludinii TaxID=187979 RepID=UPI0022E01DD0|nr:DUF1156 domain-containing protein [Mitsuokella jalaludinii]
MKKIKKLIEVAMPLEVINAASVREKSIRHGHPSTLHLWWSRKPLAAARAVIFASLVDAPSSHPELFPTPEDQERERQRLFDIIERLVKWENSNNPEVLSEAKAEIKKWVGDDVPALLDPFAGGGTIPLEAQRLGLKAYAGDLNPVAVMINKAMIEIPPRFASLPPVNPKDRTAMLGGADGYQGAHGLAADVRYYGEWMRDEAFRRIGHLYPKVKAPETGEELTVIAWIWARTVKCPNPACGCEMPLVNSFWLSKKKGHEAWIEPCFEGKQVSFVVHHNDMPKLDGTVDRKGAVCAHCGEPVRFSYIREEGKKGKMKEQLMAVVAEGKNQRRYLAVDDFQRKAAAVAPVEGFSNAYLPDNPRDFKTPNYGMKHFSDLFTNRQLMALTTFSTLIPKMQQIAKEDAIQAGLPDDDVRLEAGGRGATAYGEAIGVYLAFVVDKMTDYNSSICSWNVARDNIRNVFGRQAIPMIWNYAESNPFCSSSGSYKNMLAWVEKCVENLPATGSGTVQQTDAQSDNGLRHIMVSTDPPYYDNISYAEVSDYFYIWLRQSLRMTYPKLFQTMLVPRGDELVATSYRFRESKAKAKDFFVDGMKKTCQQIYQYTRDDIPVTIYYAYKQKDDNDKDASTGWETILSSIISSSFTITGTWPIQTERAARSNALGANSLASSIVLVCRKRESTHQVCSRKDFIRQLRRELSDSISKLQSAGIAPVDLMQSAIGPGISVYSRYDQVLEADGTEMTVRTALRLISQELDAFLSGQSDRLDGATSFAVTLFQQCGYDELDFGQADVLARAKNISVDDVAEAGVVAAGNGRVRLLTREELPQAKNMECGWLRLQHLTAALEKDGIQGCVSLLRDSIGEVDYLKNLAYHMYQLAEEKGMTQEAGAYNALVISWEDILDAAAAQRQESVEELDFGEDY